MSNKLKITYLMGVQDVRSKQRYTLQPLYIPTTIRDEWGKSVK